MYTTRTLSSFKKTSQNLSDDSQEGPNWGYLVIQDKLSFKPFCFGKLLKIKNGFIQQTPLPSNRPLEVYNVSFVRFVIDVLLVLIALLLPMPVTLRMSILLVVLVRVIWLIANDPEVFFAIPVVNEQISKNRYYIIKARRGHRGEAYVSSKEANKIACFGISFSLVKGVNPRPLDPEDIHQQFHLTTTATTTIFGTNNTKFRAKSAAPDGYPPQFLARKTGFDLRLSSFDDYMIRGEAKGLDIPLRASLPGFNFPVSCQSSDPVCVGKWYTPFMFIHEGSRRDQVKKCVFYEIKLEQYWERIFTSQNTNAKENKVMMDVVVPTEEVSIGGKSAVLEGGTRDTKVAWFRTVDGNPGQEERRVGLSSLVLERMVWEAERFGWVNQAEKQVRVVKEEEHQGGEDELWCRFGCYVLVERFNVGRMDGSLVMSYGFKHTQKLRTKWELALPSEALKILYLS